MDPLQRDSMGALSDIAGTSAQLLKSSPDPKDKALVREAVCISPKSMAAWYAVALQEKIPEDVTDLAYRTMNDSGLPDELRIAAAVVYGKKGIAGNEHVARTLGAFVETIGKKSLREMVEPNEWSSPAYATLQQKLVMFYAALLVPREVVEKPVFDAMSGRNELLQGMGLYLAVRLWPERVLEMVRTGVFEQDEAAVCAAIVTFHPNKRVEVEAFVNSSELDAHLREMDATGVSVRGFPLSRNAFGLLDTSIAP